MKKLGGGVYGLPLCRVEAVGNDSDDGIGRAVKEAYGTMETGESEGGYDDDNADGESNDDDNDDDDDNGVLAEEMIELVVGDIFGARKPLSSVSF